MAIEMYVASVTDFLCEVDLVGISSFSYTYEEVELERERGSEMSGTKRERRDRVNCGCKIFLFHVNLPSLSGKLLLS